MISIEFSQRFTLGMVDKMLLDAAHDAGPIYDLLLHQNIKPFIDLNIRGTEDIRRKTKDVILDGEMIQSDAVEKPDLMIL